MPLVQIQKPFAFGKLTQTAGTVINRFVPPAFGFRPLVQELVFTNGATAHTLTGFRTLNRTRVAADAAGAAASFQIMADPGNYTFLPDYCSADFLTANRGLVFNGKTPGPHNVKAWTPSVANNLIAANDWVAVRQPDGIWWVGQPSAVATGADGVVTLTATVPTGGFVKGAEVHFLGATTDTNPNSGLAHQQWAGVASDTQVFSNEAGILVGDVGDALLIQSNNATNAGTIDRVSGGYMR